MASSWETDPLLAAADDVQQSADRMESAYRKWSSKKACVEEGSLGKSKVNLCIDDVATALDTTKWQLEEFTKAVKQSDAFLRGEDVSKRHVSFIDAIQNQIVPIEDAIHSRTSAQFWNSSFSVKLDGKERDQLEIFLSGGDAAAKDLSAQEVNPHISSHPSEIHELGSNGKRPNGLGLLCEHPSSEHDLDSLPTLNDLCADVCPSNALFGRNYGRTGIFLSSHPPSMVCEPRQRNACPGIMEEGRGHEEELIGTQTLHTNATHFVQPNTDISPGDLHEKNPHGVKRPPGYRNRVKRWRSGTLCIDVGEKGDAMRRWCKEVPQPDIEGGCFSGDSRSDRQSHAQMVGSWRLHRFPVARHVAVCKFSGRAASFLLILLCLCCMYLWSLSSLVPYINTVFPHKFGE